MAKPLKILMLCWEYPPLITGGLGNACAGISKALAEQGHQIDVLLPKLESEHEKIGNPALKDINLVSLNEQVWDEDLEVVEQLKDLHFGFTLVPYLPPKFFHHESSQEARKKVKRTSNEISALDEITLEGGYGGQLMAEVHKFAILACQHVLDGQYDIVHIHDWMTFKAGSLIQKITDLPVIFHVHSVESDRNGTAGNQEIIQIEKETLTHARYVVAVSGKLREKIGTDYGVSEQKIEVVPNGISGKWLKPQVAKKPPIVGFIGRLTHQKGPSYFLDVARELRSKIPRIQFYVVGDGYLEEELQEKADRRNLPVIFTGFLEGKELEHTRAQLDLLIAPSISEPFGLVILEALQAGIPVLTTPNTGISEFVPLLPQINSWDVHQLVGLSESLLINEKERTTLTQKCQEAARNLSWESSAEKFSFLYEGILSK